MQTTQKKITDDLDVLLDSLPPSIADPLRRLPERHDLLEVIQDLGRPPEARLPDHEIVLREQEVTADDIEYGVARIGTFGDDNRAGIARTLHRISAIRNRQGRIVEHIVGARDWSSTEALKFFNGQIAGGK